MTTQVLHGDCRQVLKTLPDESVNCILSSPPYYGLRDYGVDGQIGLEQTPDEYVAELVAVFREARRVLRKDGVLWLNLGDSYAGSGKGGDHVGSLYGTGKTAREAAVTNVTRKTFRAGSGRADGVVDERTQRNRNGVTGVSNGDIKAKDLIGIPWIVAFALRADGWYLRQDIIWSKPNPMPESVTDRCTKAHEYLFLLSKSARYYFDADAVAEPVATSSIARFAQNIDAQKGSERVPGKANGTMKAVRRTNVKPGKLMAAEPVRGETTFGFGEMRNRRSVWEIATRPFAEAHFATMAPELARICIMAGCPLGGTVLDPFGGAGTTALVADQLQRNAILIELNPDYADMARNRVLRDAGMFADA